ncbi:MAG: phosphatidate cytidylyltransferase [Planctomycetota bacterium]
MEKILPSSRVVPACILITITYIPFVLFLTFHTNLGFFVLFGVILALSLFELYKLFHIEDKYTYTAISIILALYISQMVYNSITRQPHIVILISIAVYLLYILFEKLENRNQQRLYKILIVYLCSLVYLFLPITLYLFFSFSVAGLNLLLYSIIICKVSDTGALIVGKKYGTMKLAPNISPNKTLEGLIGSIIVGSIFSSLFYFFSPVLKKVDFLSHLFTGLIVILLNNIGDLWESFLKRLNNVKDSSHLCWGIGGVLDLIDGIIFASPALFIYYHYLRN